MRAVVYWLKKQQQTPEEKAKEEFSKLSKEEKIARSKAIWQGAVSAKQNQLNESSWQQNMK